MRTVLITGISGMDGSYLAELLLGKGYKVYGLHRRNSTDNTWRIKDIINDIELVSGDLTDQNSLNKTITLTKPDEIYNMAAQSYVGVSWSNPEVTMNINAIGVLRLLEAVRSFGKKETKVFQASSSEMFGKVQETPQTEDTPFYPRSPYGVSKCTAHWICKNYRESYNMFIACGISFNHTSPRRGIEFVERKISYNVAKIKLGLTSYIELGNLYAKRDWSWAPEFCWMFWKILQLSTPQDFVLASGKTYSIKEYLKQAFKCIGIIEWKKFYRPNPNFMRPAEVDLLLGDYTKASRILGFSPKIGFKEIVSKMVASDLELLKNDKHNHC